MGQSGYVGHQKLPGYTAMVETLGRRRPGDVEAQRREWKPTRLPGHELTHQSTSCMYGAGRERCSIAFGYLDMHLSV